MEKVDIPAQGALYGGAVSSITFLGIGAGEWAAIISAAIAVVGGLVHIYCQTARRRDERAEHLARMVQLTGGTPPAK